MPALRAIYKGPIFANISGFSIDEYAYVCERIDKETDAAILEVNISCPNVHNGGMAFGTNPEAAAAVTKAVKAVTNKPVFMKLSPNVTDIASIARACVEAGADGLCLINTVLGMRIDIKRRKPVLANTYGGYSGPGVFPIALRMVHQVHKACPETPIIGCGGVSRAEDVIEMMMAGASAVEIGAASLQNPTACREIIEALPTVMKEMKIDHLQDIIGIV
jgi:dihydroorotate dehydrogenase (NAD+) catalytic subunit